MNDSFFGKNGTMEGALNLANNISGMKSDSATGRLGALSRLVQTVMMLLA